MFFLDRITYFKKKITIKKRSAKVPGPEVERTSDKNFNIHLIECEDFFLFEFQLFGLLFVIAISFMKALLRFFLFYKVGIKACDSTGLTV
ncbi:hypothetical protein M0811_03905 [Anaeramoeba ignava]|uniref:Uncharacterized protein n=1 Tax=Anaeramoeba ignava TaxID=1746090 RepID=A0A9Q0M017_ANAIG|nr:hypothetical protein M0811_03905 [Anaeramoeba ignava]